MKFEILKASDWDFFTIVELKSMQDLKNLCEKYNEKIVVDFRFEIPVILIYDDWIK